ncbi:TPA: acyl-CoA dehydrogenase domain-containing protein [Pseudomonas aeruginosa]
MGAVLRRVFLPLLSLNPVGRPPADTVGREAARTLQRDGEQFTRLAQGVFLPAVDAPGLGRLLGAFRLVSAAQPAQDKLAQLQRARKLPRGSADTVAALAAQQGLLSATEAEQIEIATQARLQAIEVDVFTPERFLDSGCNPDEAPAHHSTAISCGPRSRP